MIRVLQQRKRAFRKMEKILFDCDTGSDDAVALMMLLKANKVATCVGVTCVTGNTGLDNVVMNNLRILKLFNKLEDVPVYRGCEGPLITTQRVLDAEHVHGLDGMGNRPEQEPAVSQDFLKHLKREHAANAIVSLSKQYEGELKLVATGPLTNLAMAVKLDPKLPSRLKALYVMGGSRYSKGNTTPAAEYNFYCDPEATYITLHGYSQQCPVHLIDWDVTKDYPLPEPWVEDWYRERPARHFHQAPAVPLSIKEKEDWHSRSQDAASMRYHCRLATE